MLVTCAPIMQTIFHVGVFRQWVNVRNQIDWKLKITGTNRLLLKCKDQIDYDPKI